MGGADDDDDDETSFNVDDEDDVLEINWSGQNERGLNRLRSRVRVPSKAFKELGLFF